MSIISFWFSRTFRARARSYGGVAVLLALLGGLTLTSFAGARRTASAYPRFREAGNALDVLFFHVQDPGHVLEVPGVTSAATYLSFVAAVVDADGRPDADYANVSIEMVGSHDGLYFTRDRFAVTKGRMPDPTREDEVAVNEHVVAQGIGLGRRYPIGVFNPAQEDAEGLTGVGRFPGSAQVLPVQRPAEIVHYESMGATPAVLGGVLVVAAVVSLGLALASSVGRRRRDLSILKSLGFTRGQVSAAVVWQSSLIVGIGLILGVPLGIALGRWLWILFADRLPVLARPSVPALVLVGVGFALVLFANLVAAVPARSAGRAPVATILRSE